MLGSFELMTGFLRGFFSLFAQAPFHTIMIILLILVVSLAQIMQLLLVLALSNTGRSKRYKLLKGILIYYGINMAINTVVTVALTLAIIPMLSIRLSSDTQFFIITSILMAIFIGISIAFYFISRHLIVKKIELE